MILITERLLEVIRRHGRESYAEEACGVLYGRSSASGKVVEVVEPLANSRDGERHRRFLITPADYRRAEERAVRDGLDLLGFYHSHPDHPALPSDYDRDHALPFFSYVIISVRERAPGEVRSFVLAEDRSAFDEERLQTTQEKS